MTKYLAACTALVLCALTACSNANPPPATDDLVPGTLDVAVDGRPVDSPDGVKCERISSYTTLTSGDDGSTVRVLLDSAPEMRPVSVQLVDVGGFTGSYLADLQGDAQAHLDGSTFVVTGQADGFFADRPSGRATGEFAISFAC